LAVFGRFMLECMHRVLLSIEMGLHVCLGVDRGGFRHCMWTDGGELCYSRPSELVSPRREYQDAHPASVSSSSPRRRALVLSDTLSRSGESDSPKRVLEENLVPSASRSRSGEGDSPRRELAECPCHRTRPGDFA